MKQRDAPTTATHEIHVYIPDAYQPQERSLTDGDCQRIEQYARNESRRMKSALVVIWIIAFMFCFTLFRFQVFVDHPLLFGLVVILHVLLLPVEWWFVHSRAKRIAPRLLKNNKYVVSGYFAEFHSHKHLSHLVLDLKNGRSVHIPLTNWKRVFSPKDKAADLIQALAKFDPLTIEIIPNTRNGFLLLDAVTP